MRRLRDRMDQDLEIRGYSPSTRQVYGACVKAFTEHFKGAPPAKLGLPEIREYQLYLTQERRVSWCYFNQSVAALRFLFKVTLDKSWSIDRIPYKRRGRRLPVVLSQEEVAALLAAARTLRDRAIMMTLYGCGLRLAEARHLLVSHIDSGRMVVRVVQGKGQKDRYVRLPDTLLQTLRAYWRQYRPKSLLFPGADPEHPLAGATIQDLVRSSAKRAGIAKQVTPHALRHAYATHHLEQGTNLREIQLLLGHRSLNSTMIYTHVAQSTVAAASSPLDGLAGKEKQVPKHP